MMSGFFFQWQTWLRRFTPKQMGRLGMVTLAMVSTVTPTMAQRSPRDLTDINDHWAEFCIQQLYQREIVSGYPDKTFRPNEPVTRTEFAAMVTRAFPDAPTQVEQKSYPDVDETYWGLIPIYRATQTGFMRGYSSGIFQPTKNILRYEVLLSLVAGLNYTPQADPQTLIPRYYEDAASLPPFAYRAIAAATEKGLVVNYPNVYQLNPQDPASRAEVAAFLCRALDTSGTIPSQFIPAVP